MVRGQALIEPGLRALRGDARALRLLHFIGVIALLAAAAPRIARAQAVDVPYVPTPMNVVETMLGLAKVGPADFVIDLGSGDGRIVITAAKKYGARGFGVDLDGALVSQARREAERQGVSDRVQFYARNLFVTDIDRATVLTSYLFSHVNVELRPRIFGELKPGARVVSHEFDFGNWKPDAQARVDVPGKPYGPPVSDVYLWIVPANAAGKWIWRGVMAGAEVDWELELNQTFQVLQGSARVSGRAARIESARLSGAAIAINLVTNVNGRDAVQVFSGRIDGDTIRGTSRAQGTSADAEWLATRIVRGKINIDA